MVLVRWRRRVYICALPSSTADVLIPLGVVGRRADTPSMAGKESGGGYWLLWKPSENSGPSRSSSLGPFSSDDWFWTQELMGGWWRCCSGSGLAAINSTAWQLGSHRPNHRLMSRISFKFSLCWISFAAKVNDGCFRFDPKWHSGQQPLHGRLNVICYSARLPSGNFFICGIISGASARNSSIIYRIFP